MEGVHIREAKLTDVEEILTIRNAYAGRDYLPEFIHGMLSRHTGYVAVYHGKIIGFIIAAIVDEGKTLLPRAGRVREDFEGRGIYKMMDKHIMDIYGHLVDFKALCFHDKNITLVKKFEDGSLNTTFFRELVVFKAVRNKLNPHKSSRAMPDVEELNKKDLKDILTSKQLCKSLFSEKEIVVSFWVPLRLLKGNVDFILSENGIVVGSCVKKGTDQSKALISIAHSYNCSLGRIINIDIYGNKADNLVHHLTNHLKRALENTSEEVILFEVFPEPALKLEVIAAMTELEFEIYNWDVASKLYCVEYNLKT